MYVYGHPIAPCVLTDAHGNVSMVMVSPNITRLSDSNDQADINKLFCSMRIVLRAWKGFSERQLSSSA